MNAPSPTLPIGDLTGTTALITGAGARNGIGFATAQTLGRMGARVIVAATSARINDRADELQAEAIEATPFIGDLTDQSVVTELAQRHRDIDILVNNAGMISVNDDGESGTLLDTSTDVWRASIERNLTTAFAVTRAVIPGMIERHWGRIVMVSSVTGPIVAYPGDVAYAAAKAGMTGLMRGIAVEVGSEGITVNAVAPGWIDTDSATDDERRMGRATPVGRPGRADEVAAIVALCCAREASYLTGQVLVVDGGNVVQDDKRLLTD